MNERMVRVEWLDAVSYSEDVPDAWVEKIAKAGGVPTTSTGTLLKSSRRCVIIVMTKYEDCCRYALCIPRRMIKKITYLEPRDG
jgi:hypothetical protein